MYTPSTAGAWSSTVTIHGSDVTPPAEAVIFAVPPPTAVTVPSSSTSATSSSSETHVTAASSISLPSFAVTAAVSAVLSRPPAVPRRASAGSTETDFTSGTSVSSGSADGSAVSPGPTVGSAVTSGTSVAGTDDGISVAAGGWSPDGAVTTGT